MISKLKVMLTKVFFRNYVGLLYGRLVISGLPVIFLLYLYNKGSDLDTIYIWANVNFFSGFLVAGADLLYLRGVSHIGRFKIFNILLFLALFLLVSPIFVADVYNAYINTAILSLPLAISLITLSKLNLVNGS